MIKYFQEILKNVKFFKDHGSNLTGDYRTHITSLEKLTIAMLNEDIDLKVSNLNLLLFDNCTLWLECFILKEI